MDDMMPRLASQTKLNAWDHGSIRNLRVVSSPT